MGSVGGPRAGRVYQALRERIVEGLVRAGEKLPSHTALAAEFGVAPLTMRHVLGRLQQEGLVSLEHGRGTFVREPLIPAVLVVDDEHLIRQLLGIHVRNAGYRLIEADGPEAGMAALEGDQGRTIGLVLSDVRMPNRRHGVEFICTVRRRWPELPLAVITAYPDDLDELYDTPECPVLIVPKPVRAAQVRQVLQLAIHGPQGSGLAAPLAAGVPD
jgi:DNA-binding transcriptional regulator YhcF (GntR family)